MPNDVHDLYKYLFFEGEKDFPKPNVHTYFHTHVCMPLECTKIVASHSVTVMCTPGHGHGHGAYPHIECKKFITAFRHHGCGQALTQLNTAGPPDVHGLKYH
jgi:hypothetical protein